MTYSLFLRVYKHRKFFVKPAIHGKSSCTDKGQGFLLPCNLLV